MVQIVIYVIHVEVVINLNKETRLELNNKHKYVFGLNEHSTHSICQNRTREVTPSSLDHLHCNCTVFGLLLICACV